MSSVIPFDWHKWFPTANRLRQLDPRVLLALSLGGVGLLSVLRAVWRDYRTYMAYGPSELPCSVRGWFISSALMRPLGTDVFSTDVYDSNPDKRSWLPQDSPKRERGPRPRLGPHPMPQRQLDQYSPVDIRLRLAEAFAKLVNDHPSLLQFKPSLHEGKSTQSIFLADDVAASPIAQEMFREVCHIHATGDHTVHAVLAPQDCNPS
ncbi:hypothetical protein VTN77DRAFT_5250 [Rasamsonia byssochlamydoides]|uniref:uncharacterized protein n=1 Tax=Rasamsonia byssochlamydoides TaxID=89139 RepID=UPI0037421C5D